ncbi:MAG: hypothetical protein IJY04_09400 [Clostridia bacterium]|nr:hypothetical protein [Clostridia bacterium]
MTLSNGTDVVVETSRGLEYGTVCMENRIIRSTEVVMPIKEVIRIATSEDTERNRRNKELEITAYNTFIERIDAHGLEMKLIDVECAFDNSRLLFYFSAESRIDFRELVRELAGIFHTRIELRQIGIRDEAKMLGGIGICGRPFCCSSFLSDFVQVSMKMAKEQNLAMNSAKISGACGRLMCCLRYEYDTYLAEKALTPPVGSEVVTPDGEGIVTEANPMTGIVKVRLGGTASDDSPVLYVREDLVLKEKYNGEVLKKTPLPQKQNPNRTELGGFTSAYVSSALSSDTDSDSNTATIAENENASQNSQDPPQRNNRKDKKKRDQRPSPRHDDAEAKTVDMADTRHSDQPATDNERGEDKPARNNRFGGKDRRNGKGSHKQFHDKPNTEDISAETVPSAPSEPESGEQNKKKNHDRFGKNSKGKKPYHHGNHKDGNASGNSDSAPTTDQQNTPKPHNTVKHKNSPGNQNSAPTADNGSDQQHAPKPQTREGGKKPYRPFHRHGKPRSNGGNPQNKPQGGGNKEG